MKTSCPASVALCLALGASAPAPAPDRFFPDLLVRGARLSIHKAPRYDPSYVRIRYPGGDPGWERGVCSDVVIRAFRHAGIDLQRLVAEDIARSPLPYGISSPDPHIDHRRVRNLKVFLSRRARILPTDPRREWLAGDIVVWDLYGGTAPNHIGILSDRKGPSGLPLVVHHFRARDGFTGFPSEDDCLTRWRILAHFRWSPSPP